MADIVKSAEKEIKKEERKLGKFFKKTNTWVGISAVLLILLVVVFAMNFGMTGNAAGEKLVNFLNSQVVQGGGVTLKSVESKGSLYQVNVLYQGKEIPVFITKDGKYFVQGASEITPSDSSITGEAVTDTPKEVPKTDKPKVEAFVFSYCPYGLQFEKALIPVYNLLKNKADINIVFIGAMHGEYEHQESLRQIAILNLYGKDKLFTYLDKFVASTDIGACSSNTACSTPLVEKLMTSLGIDKAKVNTFMTTKAEALYSADEQRAASLGISGSPDFVVNGVEVQAGRNSEAIKKIVCDAFTDGKKPSECSQTLSTTSASAGFGGTAGSASAASCG